MLNREIMFIQVVQIERRSEKISRDREKACTSDGGGEVSSHVYPVVQGCDKHWDGYALSIVGKETVVGEGVEGGAGRTHIPWTWGDQVVKFWAAAIERREKMVVKVYILTD
jgi:hypothetical protein